MTTRLDAERGERRELLIHQRVVARNRALAASPPHRRIAGLRWWR